MNSFRLGMVVSMLLLFTVLVSAQETLSTRLVKVALFKQGYGVIVREATVPAGERTSAIVDVPTPVHGTFWIIAPPSMTVQSVTASEDTKERTVAAITLPELLSANIGEIIEVKTADGWIDGKLLSVAEDRVMEDTSPPGMTSESPYPYSSARSFGSTPPRHDMANLLVLDTKDGPTALPVSSVQQLRKPVSKGALKTTKTLQQPGAILKLRTTGAGGTVQIAYLTRGITWAPSYRLELQGKTAHLSGKAVVVNDAEDLSGGELACVAGYPNIKFARVVDPLAVQGSLAQFLASLQAPTGGNAEPGVMSQAVVSNSGYASPFPTLPAPDADASADDLHFYRFKDITIQKGERTYLPLFDVKVPCSDVYRWEARDLRAGHDGYPYNNQSPVPQTEDIWHAVKLSNSGKIPWTTAPVMSVQGDEFIGQDILDYTSPGSSTLVNLTKAVDVKARMDESTQGMGERVTINTRSFQKFIIGGRLHIDNFKSTAVHLIISKKLTGDVVETSLKPSSVDEAPRKDLANALNTLTWEIDIPAQGSTEITYKYNILMP